MSLGNALLNDYIRNGARALQEAIKREPDCKIVVHLLRDKIASEAPLFLQSFEEDFHAELAEPPAVFGGGGNDRGVAPV